MSNEDESSEKNVLKKINKRLEESNIVEKNESKVEEVLSSPEMLNSIEESKPVSRQQERRSTLNRNHKYEQDEKENWKRNLRRKEKLFSNNRVNMHLL